MIGNRELSMDDYLAMLRRRVKVILLPAILAPLAGFLVSYAFSPRYTSQSTVLVEEQKVPEGYVKPVTTEDVMQRIATIQQKVFARSRLKAMVERLGLVKRGRTVDDVISDIQQNVTIEPLNSDMSQAATASASKKKKAPGKSATPDVPGFTLSYTTADPNEAREVCSQLTGLMLEENLHFRQETAQSTTAFLTRQVDEAKEALDQQDSKLADFKKQHLCQLKDDQENNMKILTTLNSRLDATNQAVNRAEQDRDYQKSLLTQQIAAWKATQSSNNPVTLQQQLASLQSQLMTLQSRYTDDHPDVVKTKNDIAEIKRKLAEINSAPPQDNETATKGNSTEPTEIQQSRLKIHQLDVAIAQGTKEQETLGKKIDSLTRLVVGSPSVEEQYSQLSRDYGTAQKHYADLLTNKNDSELHAAMENQQQGEQFRLVGPANLPDSPGFPIRLYFAGGGLGAGLAVGFGLALWLELRDKSIRTEQDVLAVLDLPMLVSLPWVRPDMLEKNGRGTGSNGRTPGEEKKETVEV